jgi:2-alkenal reductase
VPSTPVAELPISVAFQPPTPVGQDVIDAADAEYLLLSNIYDRLAPAVVNIEVIAVEEDTAILDLGRGSGFVYDDAGHIITNAHVVQDAQNIEVTFNDGYIVEADVVGVDAYSDLAVIRVDVDSARLVPMTLADSDSVRVGERAIAIGNPFGLASSMTVGIVSALGRQLPSAQLLDNSLIPGFQNPSIIQVDTDINPGNSGGPLLNSRGEVIGVNAAIRTDTGTFQGVGFAIPANTVRRVVPELIENGVVDYAWIGISALREEDGFSVAALAEPLDLPVDSGVLINSVTEGSPADQAGLLPGSDTTVIRGDTICAGGDIIIAVNGVYVDTMDELVAYLVVNNRPGDEINLLIVRDNETFEVPVQLEARPTGAVGASVNGCQE